MERNGKCGRDIIFITLRDLKGKSSHSYQIINILFLLPYFHVQLTYIYIYIYIYIYNIYYILLIYYSYYTNIFKLLFIILILLLYHIILCNYNQLYNLPRLYHNRLIIIT